MPISFAVIFSEAISHISIVSPQHRSQGNGLETYFYGLRRAIPQSDLCLDLPHRRWLRHKLITSCCHFLRVVLKIIKKETVLDITDASAPGISRYCAGIQLPLAATASCELWSLFIGWKTKSSIQALDRSILWVQYTPFIPSCHQTWGTGEKNTFLFNVFLIKKNDLWGMSHAFPSKRQLCCARWHDVQHHAMELEPGDRWRWDSPWWWPWDGLYIIKD